MIPPAAHLIPPARAREILAHAAGRPQAIAVTLEQAAGRILAADIRADRDLPPFDRAAVDGYAIRRGPGMKGEAEFLLVGSIRAGESYRGRLRPCCALKIMTGAPVPSGAEAVVMVELSEITAPGRVRLPLPPGPAGGSGGRPGIVPRGSEAARGTVLLHRGDRLDPARIAVLAGVGRVEVPVFRPPDVALLTTGEEVVGPGVQPGPWQIRDSNGPLLRALLDGAGFTVRAGEHLGHDSLQPLRRAIRRLGDSEVLVLTGGVSAGDYDLVPAALQAEGYRILFHRVAMKPGKPVLFGTRGAGRRRQVVFGLPGNPVSVLVGATEFLLPYLRARSGWPNPWPADLPAVAGGDLSRKPGLEHFVLGQACVRSDGRLAVSEVRSGGSGDYASAARANCLIRLPAGRPQARKGSKVRIRPLDAPGAGLLKEGDA
jgi:molybdopterin molybdotransferase